MIRNKVFRFVCKSGNTFIVLPLCDFILTVLLDICMCVMIYL